MNQEPKDFKAQQKEEAIKRLQRLDIYKPYINGFKAKAQKVCFFENFAGFWVYQEPEIEAKMKEIEQEYGYIVYAITHEYTAFGECYDFLLVSKYDEEWDYELEQVQAGTFYAFAYVWNRTDEWCSELGTIGVKSYGGGITRVA